MHFSLINLGIFSLIYVIYFHFNRAYSERMWPVKSLLFFMKISFLSKYKNKIIAFVSVLWT